MKPIFSNICQYFRLLVFVGSLLEANNKITKKIKDYDILLDIDMLDPIIVSDDRFSSFADVGELSPNSRKPVSWVGFLLDYI